MKCKLTPTVTPRQREAISKIAREKAMEETADIVRRVYKIVCLSLNKQFGFGAVRLARLLAETQAVSGQVDADEELWTHIDARLHQMGLDFEAEDKP